MTHKTSQAHHKTSKSSAFGSEALISFRIVAYCIQSFPPLTALGDRGQPFWNNLEKCSNIQESCSRTHCLGAQAESWSQDHKGYFSTKSIHTIMLQRIQTYCIGVPTGFWILWQVALHSVTIETESGQACGKQCSSGITTDKDLQLTTDIRTYQNWDNSWINKKLWASHWNDKHDNWDVPNTLALKHWNIDRILQIRRETIEATVKFVDVSGSTHCDAIAPLTQHVDHYVKSYMMWHESRIKKIRNWSIQLSAELGRNLGRNVAWKKGAFVNFPSLKPTLSSPRLN